MKDFSVFFLHFDQQMGALHAVRWYISQSNSIYSRTTIIVVAKSDHINVTEGGVRVK